MSTLRGRLPILSTQEHDRLLNQLRDWCRQDRGRQRLIAKELSVSPQLVSAWITGVRSMSLDEWTQIQAVINKESAGAQFPENKIMSSIRIDPPAMPRQAASNPGQPKTLHEAKEMIEALRLEITQLKAGKAVAITPTPTAKPKLAGSGADAPPVYPPTGTPGADRPNPVPMHVNPPATPKKALPPEANTPFLIGEILKVTSFDDLLSMLDNPVHTPIQQSAIYKEVKARRQLVANRFE